MSEPTYLQLQKLKVAQRVIFRQSAENASRPIAGGSSPVDLFEPPAAGGSPPLAPGRPVVPPFLSLAKGRLPLDLKRNPRPSVAS